MNIRLCVYTRFSMQGKCDYSSYARGNRRLSLRFGSFGSYLALYYVCVIECTNSSPSMIKHMSPNNFCFYLSCMNMYNNVLGLKQPLYNPDSLQCNFILNLTFPTWF